MNSVSKKSLPISTDDNLRVINDMWGNHGWFEKCFHSDIQIRWNDHKVQNYITSHNSLTIHIKSLKSLCAHCDGSHNENWAINEMSFKSFLINCERGNGTKKVSWESTKMNLMWLKNFGEFNRFL